MKTNNNMRSLEKLLEIRTGLGENYRPGQQKLQVEALTTLLRQAEGMVNAANAAETAHSRTTNERVVQFSDLGKLATRVLNALIASGATTQNVADARAFVRKLTGQQSSFDRAVIPSVAVTQVTTPANSAPATKRRKSGRDYSSRVDTFRQLIGRVEAEPNYQPQEAALQIATLKEKLQVLSDNNRAVIHSAEVLRQARADRDAVLFKQSNSVYRVGQMAKAYVKAAFGSDSDSYQAVRKLSFTAKPK